MWLCSKLRGTEGKRAGAGRRNVPRRDFTERHVFTDIATVKKKVQNRTSFVVRCRSAGTPSRRPIEPRRPPGGGRAASAAGRACTATPRTRTLEPVLPTWSLKSGAEERLLRRSYPGIAALPPHICSGAAPASPRAPSLPPYEYEPARLCHYRCRLPSHQTLRAPHRAAGMTA